MTEKIQLHDKVIKWLKIKCWHQTVIVFIPFSKVVSQCFFIYLVRFVFELMTSRSKSTQTIPCSANAVSQRACERVVTSVNSIPTFFNLVCSRLYLYESKLSQACFTKWRNFLLLSTYLPIYLPTYVGGGEGSR